MLKTGLSIAHFRRYVPLIEKETIDYFERWGDSGERGKISNSSCFSITCPSFTLLPVLPPPPSFHPSPIDLFVALSELIIFTASRCLHGNMYIKHSALVCIASIGRKWHQHFCRELYNITSKQCISWLPSCHT